jgi:hypothetical protein
VHVYVRSLPSPLNKIQIQMVAGWLKRPLADHESQTTQKLSRRALLNLKLASC